MYSRGSTKKIKHKELKGKKKMRVTKIIREYVEETVNGIYDPIIGNFSYMRKKNIPKFGVGTWYVPSPVLTSNR